MLETLKNEAPPTRKHDLGVSEGTHFHDFRHMFQGQFQGPHFIDFSSNFIGFGTPFRHLGDDFPESVFQVSKKTKYFFTARSWVGSIFDPSGRRGELGGIWEASRRQGARGGPEEAGIEKVDRSLQPNSKVAFVFESHDAFLRVGITNYQFFIANNDAR